MNRQMPVLLKPFVLLTYVLLLAPLVIVVAVSFGTSPNYQFPPTQLSLKWYRAFFSNPEFVRAFFSVSLVLGLLAAIFATLLGTAAAIGLVRFRFKGRETSGSLLSGAAVHSGDPVRGVVVPDLRPARHQALHHQPVIRARRRLRAIRDPQRDGRPCWVGPASRGGSNESLARAACRPSSRSLYRSFSRASSQASSSRSSSHFRTSIWRCSLPDPTAQRCPSTFSICYFSKGIRRWRRPRPCRSWSSGC